jgi:hypothetical protein
MIIFSCIALSMSPSSVSISIVALKGCRTAMAFCSEMKTNGTLNEMRTENSCHKKITGGATHQPAWAIPTHRWACDCSLMTMLRLSPTVKDSLIYISFLPSSILYTSKTRIRYGFCSSFLVFVVPTNVLCVF